MQSVIAEGTGVVSRIHEILAENIGTQKYKIWFKDSTRLALADGYLKIGVPNNFIGNWLERHFLNDISHAVQSATGSNHKVIFSVDPELGSSQKQIYASPAEGTAQKTQHSAQGQRGERLPYGGKKLKLSLDTFVVGQSNELAYNAAKMVAREKQSPFNPLFIHGGYGVGKTHLMQGICNEVGKSRPGTNWLYLSAEDFANQFILALKTKKLEAFRYRMRRTDLLAIDDIHFLAGKPSTQEEFLHTFNSIDLDGKQVVLVSDAHPKMIEQLSDKLVNRFISGMVVKIETPDFQTRCRICEQFAASMGKHVPESVIRYIAEHLRSNVRELEGALLKLIAFSSLQNDKVNLEMAREVLAEHLSRMDPMVHISDIESVVSKHFGITPGDLHSPRKDRTITLARHFSMYLARKHTKMSSPEIGRCMGDKNHATVLLACKKIEEQLGINAELHWHNHLGNKISKAMAVLACLEKDITG